MQMRWQQTPHPAEWQRWPALVLGSPSTAGIGLTYLSHVTAGMVAGDLALVAGDTIEISGISWWT